MIIVVSDEAVFSGEVILSSIGVEPKSKQDLKVFSAF